MAEYMYDVGSPGLESCERQTDVQDKCTSDNHERSTPNRHRPSECPDSGWSDLAPGHLGTWAPGTWHQRGTLDLHFRAEPLGFDASQVLRSNQARSHRSSAASP